MSILDVKVEAFDMFGAFQTSKFGAFRTSKFGGGGGGGGGGVFCTSYILHPRCITPTLLAQFTVLFTFFS